MCAKALQHRLEAVVGGVGRSSSTGIGGIGLCRVCSLHGGFGGKPRGLLLGRLGLAGTTVLPNQRARDARSIFLAAAVLPAGVSARRANVPGLVQLSLRRRKQDAALFAPLSLLLLHLQYLVGRTLCCSRSCYCRMRCLGVAIVGRKA